MLSADVQAASHYLVTEEINPAPYRITIGRYDPATPTQNVLYQGSNSQSFWGRIRSIDPATEMMVLLDPANPVSGHLYQIIDRNLQLLSSFQTNTQGNNWILAWWHPNLLLNVQFRVVSGHAEFNIFIIDPFSGASALLQSDVLQGLLMNMSFDGENIV